MYGTEANMSQQQYPPYYPKQLQQEWKPQPQPILAELQSVDRRHEM
jgi:hypothetical protein